ncbi:phage tail tape measure protein [Cellulosilyticum lentocellum]|uniref:Phage tail tape measure protein, TP901 family n=1 Tax=Cellulosilyticum lentocellum (strain ATCC 49066 / DSM 5427 / NCIMB 11756 / RHM5) TaxID=642492 RepID=F2JJT5_CELLD|nr:phage tail tape measure protein [Cellulosilyticum lentocellum]ADZ83217.1 phage tail tape measure protein, TP901 family [Cellulosilyticum lentocellum DSM 5427]
MATQDIEGLAVRATMEDSDLKKGMKDLASQLKSIKSEFTLAQAGVKGFSTSLEGMKAKSENLAKQINVQSQMVDKFKEALSRSETALTNSKNKQEELRVAMEATKRQYDEEVAANGKRSDKAKELNEAYKKLEQQYAKNTSKMQNNNKSVADANTRYNQAQATLRTMTAELGETNQAIVKQSSAWYALAKACEASSKKLRAVGNTMNSVGNSLSMYATMPILAVGTATVKAASSFEAAMSEVKAISGATGEEFDALVEKARHMGETTKYSATQSAEALKYMAMAGWRTQQMLDGLEGIMYLAASSGEELGSVSDIVTDSMTAFGMSAEEASHFADVLAAASAASNSSVATMGESFTYAAPLAGTFGYSIEDVALALGLMANNGIKASQGGTALRKIFAQMSDDIEVLQANGEKLIVKTTNADGSMRSLDSVLRDLRAAFNGMSDASKTAINDDLVQSAKDLGVELTDEKGTLKDTATLYGEVQEAVEALTKSTDGLTDAQKVQEAEAIGGKTAMAGLLTLINSSEEDYNKLSDAIYNCEGAAEEMAEIMNDNLQGQFVLLKSQLEGVAIQLGETFIPMFRDALTTVSGWITKFSELDQETQKNIIKWTMLAAAIGPVLKVGGTFLKLSSSIISGIGKISGKMDGLISVVKASPKAFTAAGLAITALVTVLALWKKSADEAREAQEKALESARNYSKTAKSLEDLKKQYKEVNELQEDDKDKKEQLKAIQEELIDSYGLEASGIDIVNGKYSEQIELLNKLKEKKKVDAGIALGQELIDSKDELDKLAKSSWFSAGSSNLGGNKNMEAWGKALSEISKEYKDLIEISSYNGSGIQMKFDSEDAEKYKDLLGEIVQNARKYGIDDTGLYDKLYTEWSNLSEALERYSQAQYEAFNFDYSNQLKEVKKQLGLQEVVEYTEEQSKAIKMMFGQSILNMDTEYQEFVADMLKSLPVVGKAMNDNLDPKGVADGLEDLGEEADELAKRLEEISGKTETYSGKLDELEKVIQKVKEGNELSADEIINLTRQYPELEACIDSTTGKYTLEASALEKVKNGLTTSTKQQLENEASKTKQVMTQTQARIKLYLQEIKAQQALSGLKFNDDGSIQDSGAFTYKMSQSKELQDMYNEYNNKLIEFKKIQEEIKNIDIVTANVGAGGSSSGKDKDSPLNKALEAFEKSRKIGEVGLNEEMTQLEKIKAAYASTAEEKVDIEEYMYNNYLDIMERKRSLGQLSYDNEIKMYEEALNKYSFTEYQKAEISSKLLDTKIEKSKEWVEQEKYYNRLSLEEERKAYERIAEYSKQSAEYKKEMAKEIYRVEKELAEQQEELEKKKQEAVKKTVEANIKAKEEEYNKTIAMIDDECNRKVEAYQAQIDALQEQYDKEEELQKQKEYDEKIADLEARMKNARTQEEFEKLAEELNDTQQAKRDYTRQQQLKSDKELLQDKIDQTKNEATIAKNVEKEKLDAYKETQNKMLEESTRIETSITEILKQQLTERENAFINSIKVQLAAANTLKSAFSSLGLGGAGGIAGGISGMTLAAASNKLQSASSNNYNTSSYSTNNNTNANMTVTNVVKNSSDISKIMNQLTAFMQQLNRAKGIK